MNYRTLNLDDLTRRLIDEFGVDPDAGHWIEQAACASTDPEVFHPEGQGSSPAKAKKICTTCPVIQQCLDHALVTNEQWGVWGGMSTVERRNEARRRGLKPPARPRRRRTTKPDTGDVAA